MSGVIAQMEEFKKTGIEVSRSRVCGVLAVGSKEILAEKFELTPPAFVEASFRKNKVKIVQPKNL